MHLENIFLPPYLILLCVFLQCPPCNLLSGCHWLVLSFVVKRQRTFICVFFFSVITKCVIMRLCVQLLLLVCFVTCFNNIFTVSMVTSINIQMISIHVYYFVTWVSVTHFNFLSRVLSCRSDKVCLWVLCRQAPCCSENCDLCLSYCFTSVRILQVH